jgi:quinol-cytochrome oxidoreductase complex cytochrome b subunit
VALLTRAVLGDILVVTLLALAVLSVGVVNFTQSPFLGPDLDDVVLGSVSSRSD